MNVRIVLIMPGIILFSIKLKMGDMVAQTWEKVDKMEKDIGNEEPLQVSWNMKIGNT